MRGPVAVSETRAGNVTLLMDLVKGIGGMAVSGAVLWLAWLFLGLVAGLATWPWKIGPDEDHNTDQMTDGWMRELKRGKR